MDRSRSGSESPVTSNLSQNKPPTGSIRLDRDRNGSLGNLLDEGSHCNGAEDVNAVCMIKNLDNGKEFVVNELKEDGMWDKIKEVGTGRQLTMKEFSTEMCVGTSPIVQELMRRQNVEDGKKVHRRRGRTVVHAVPQAIRRESEIRFNHFRSWVLRLSYSWRISAD